MYISRLVKTRDPYPGLLQFAILCLFLSQSASFIVFFYFFLLSSLFSHHRLSGGAVTPFSLQGDLVLASLVSEKPSHVLQATPSRPSWTNS
jgi:hypothetical protein